MCYYLSMSNEINSGFRTTNRSVVDDSPWGMYVWQLPNGEVLGDGDGNIMNVFCTKNNRNAIRALTEAAKSHGFEEGKAVYWPGKRRVTDEELHEQEMREKLGLTPDPLDYGALIDEAKSLRAHGN